MADNHGQPMSAESQHDVFLNHSTKIEAVVHQP